MKIFLSLSFDVKYAVENGIAPDDFFIISGTSFPTADEAIKSYEEFYWAGNSEYGKFCKKLWELGNIIQPRELYKDKHTAPKGGEFGPFEEFDDPKIKINRELIKMLQRDGFISK